MNSTLKLLVAFLLVQTVSIKAQEKVLPNPGKANQPSTESDSEANKRGNNKKPAAVAPIQDANTAADTAHLSQNIEGRDKEQTIRISSVPRVVVETVKDWSDRLAWWFSLILVIVGIGATVVGLLTLNAIKNQTGAVQDQTLAVARQATANEISAKALIDSQRAWVLVTNMARPSIRATIPGANVLNTFMFDLVNRGATVARMTDLKAGFRTINPNQTFSPTPDYIGSGTQENKPVYGRVLAPGDKNGIIAMFLGESIDDPKLESIEQGGTKLYAYARVSYFDAFDNERELQFGYVYVKPSSGPPQWELMSEKEYNKHT